MADARAHAELIAQLADAYRGGASSRALAVQIGWCHPRILRALRKAGVPIRRPGAQWGPRQRSLEYFRQVIADRASGMTFHAIGEKHGVSRQRAHQICSTYTPEHILNASTSRATASQTSKGGSLLGMGEGA